MKLEEIKKELDQLNIDDVEELLQYIKDNKLINDYTSIILEALEYKYSDSFICPICGSSHVTKTDITKMDYNVFIVMNVKNPSQFIKERF